MNLKEILEQSPVWVMIVITTGAFVVGVTITIGIIKILFQDQSKKISTMEKLEQFPIWTMIIIFAVGFIVGIGIMIIIQQYKLRKQSAEAYIEIETDIEDDEKLTVIEDDKKLIEYSPVFRSGDPIPIGFEHIKIGMRLSILQSLFSKGRIMGYDYYWIDIEDNPIIKNIMCRIKYDDENMNDGTITKLIFFFKDCGS